MQNPLRSLVRADQDNNMKSEDTSEISGTETTTTAPTAQCIRESWFQSVSYASLLESVSEHVPQVRFLRQHWRERHRLVADPPRASL
eukprot:2599931-Rhodomonas_salina.1